MRSLLLTASALAFCEGFNNNPLVANLLSGLAESNELFSRLIAPPQQSQAKNPERLLRELNLQASTSPRLAYSKAERIPALLSASVAPVLRGASGVFASNYQLHLASVDESVYTNIRTPGNKQLSETGYYKVPRVPLTIYEFESDADSRLVREACSMLSMSVTIYPTPVRGPHYRAQAINEFGSNKKFPFLYDSNTQVRITGSVAIIDYLFATYGPGPVPRALRQGQGFTNWPWIGAAVGVNLARLGAGGRYEYSTFDHETGQPLQLWAYEGSPFCKLVREILSAYEIPHTVFYTPRGSINRQRLFEATGRFQVPYLQDPNTGVDLFESEAIIEYLDKKYGLVNSPVQYL